MRSQLNKRVHSYAKITKDTWRQDFEVEMKKMFYAWNELTKMAQKRIQ